MSNAENLPVEILEQIFHHVKQRTLETRNVHEEDWQMTLSSCSLVNRNWSNVASCALWKDLRPRGVASCRMMVEQVKNWRMNWEYRVHMANTRNDEAALQELMEEKESVFQIHTLDLSQCKDVDEIILSGLFTYIPKPNLIRTLILAKEHRHLAYMTFCVYLGRCASPEMHGLVPAINPSSVQASTTSRLSKLTFSESYGEDNFHVDDGMLDLTARVCGHSLKKLCMYTNGHVSEEGLQHFLARIRDAQQNQKYPGLSRLELLAVPFRLSPIFFNSMAELTPNLSHLALSELQARHATPLLSFLDQVGQNLVHLSLTDSPSLIMTNSFLSNMTRKCPNVQELDLSVDFDRFGPRPRLIMVQLGEPGEDPNLDNMNILQPDHYLLGLLGVDPFRTKSLVWEPLDEGEFDEAVKQRLDELDIKSLAKLQHLGLSGHEEMRDGTLLKILYGTAKTRNKDTCLIKSLNLHHCKCLFPTSLLPSLALLAPAITQLDMVNCAWTACGIAQTGDVMEAFIRDTVHLTTMAVGQKGGYLGARRFPGFPTVDTVISACIRGLNQRLDKGGVDFQLCVQQRGAATFNMISAGSGAWNLIKENLDFIRGKHEGRAKGGWMKWHEVEWDNDPPRLSFSILNPISSFLTQKRPPTRSGTI